LLNIEEKTPVTVKVLSIGKLSESLSRKTKFLCLHVFQLNLFGLSQIHVHLKPITQQSTVKGEN
jgi:hypothetical protein